MVAIVKPIHPTPSLSGEDAKKIIKDVLTAPSDKSRKKNDKLLRIRRMPEKYVKVLELKTGNEFDTTMVD